MTINLKLFLLLIVCASATALSLSASVLVDPTRPPTTKQKSPTSNNVGAVQRGWTLESTLVAHDRRVAVINGQLVSEGESVDGARVIKIGKLDVLVQASGKRMTLQMLPDIVRKNP